MSRSRSRTGVVFSRAINLFFHSPSAILLALLSPIILWVLMMIMYHPQTTTLLDNVGGGDLVPAMVDGWLFSSVAVVSLFSSTLAVLLSFLSDYRSGRLGLLLASGTKKGHILWGYCLASMLMAFFICVAVVLVGQVWALAFARPVMSIPQLVTVLVGVLAGAFFFAFFNMFAIGYTLSPGTVGAYSFLMGLVVGTLSLSFTLNTAGEVFQVIGVLPFCQVASLIRNPMVTPSLSGVDPEVLSTIRQYLGTDIAFLDGPMWPEWMILAALGTWTLVMILLAYLRVRHLLRNR